MKVEQPFKLEGASSVLIITNLNSNFSSQELLFNINIPILYL